MEKILIGLAALLTGALAFLVLAPLGAALGAVSALITSWWFPGTFMYFETLTGLQAYQIGAVLGFVGGFFKASENWGIVKKEFSTLSEKIKSLKN